MGTRKDRIITSFQKIVTQKISQCKVILFGSRATGTFTKDSDYDFLLISPKFREWEWEERSAKMYYLKRNIPAAMDIICLTPEEFEKKRKQIGVIQEAFREGVEITAA